MKTDNELIAEFMGKPMTYIHDSGNVVAERTMNYEGYYTEWNNLMPVVEKIERLYSKAFPPGEKFIEMILAHEDPIDKHYTDVLSCPMSTPISEVYESVVDFIKWHNNEIH